MDLIDYDFTIKENENKSIDQHVYINARLMNVLRSIEAGAKKERNLKLNKSKLINMCILAFVNQLENISITDQLFLLENLEKEFLEFKNTRGN